jgi:glycogen debranching enzyme
MRVLLARWDPDDAETSAAEQWLASHGFVQRHADAATVGSDDVRWSDVVWCHASSVPGERLSPALRVRLSQEGGALLTLAACRLPFTCGVDTQSPVESHGVWRGADDPLWDAGFRDWPDYPHIRGLQGWAAGNHPLFEGFQRGTFTRVFADGDRYVELGYDWPAWPQGGGRVIGVERAYVKLNAHRALAWEYAVGARRLLCVGAHVSLVTLTAPLRAQRDRLLANALTLAARRAPPAATEATWPSRTRPAERYSAAPAVLPPIVEQASSDLVVNSTADQDAPFTIAGRRALVVGTEQGGVQDVWLHPLGVISGGLSLRIDDATPVAEHVQVSPAEIRRTLRSDGGTITERVVPAIDMAHVLIAYESASTDLEFEVRFQVPLRLAWPFDANALQPLVASVTGGREEQRHAVAVVASDARHCALITIAGADEVECHMQAGVPSVRIRRRRGAELRLLIAADTLGADALGMRDSRLDEAGSGTAAARQHHFAALRGRTIHSATPNAVLDVALNWAVHRLDMFIARTPDGGTGLLAGYAASRDGWSVSRPGYAWFFGRDACWCADAMLAAGMFAEVREIIQHLAATRDVTGKVIHELTTSGVAHYDAADSTPLFLRLVAAYHEWTGDGDTVREHWDAVCEALHFVASTDRDSDGIPENAGVGHGWIESGPLGGGTVTAYMAALWIDAMRRLRRVADSLDEPSVASTCQMLLEHAVQSFDVRLRDRTTRRVVLQLQPDGAPQTDLTALSAVPIALGVDQDPSADGVLALLTGASYAAPWGVRMLPTTDSRYNPRGYHFGAVWPLFTGWTALACFERGHSAAGARLLQANANLWTERAKGAFDEVLDGDTGEAAGVCPDQAWSAAMVVAPLVQGIWGVRPDASARVVRLGLQLPDDWTNASIEGLRVGRASLDVRVERKRSDRDNIDQIFLLARNGRGSLDTVIIEVLAEAGALLEMRASSGLLMVTTIRECRPGWIWHGVVISVASGEGHLTVRRA